MPGLNKKSLKKGAVLMNELEKLQQILEEKASKEKKPLIAAVYFFNFYLFLIFICSF